jgi:hypothetical protein
MNGTNGGSLSTIPVFDRLQYFYGQLLGARDFQVEQDYFREKLKLHNRCLHGYGVVCGLTVGVVPRPEECPPEDDAREDDKYSGTAPPLLSIAPGLALDCEGNELVVRRPLRFDPWKLLEPSERRRLEDDDEETLWVSLCFHEQPVEPTRPVLTDPCGAVGACTFGKLRDSVRVRVTLDRPEEDERCDTCCSPCGECCLLLAAARGYRRTEPLDEGDVDNSVRREIGPHAPAAIAGVSWSHGGTYELDQAEEILGTREGDGLEIRFTRGIRAEGLVDPVLQIYVTERGGGRSANVYELRGEFVDVPSSGLVTSLRYRQTSDESLQYGDLVTITLRAPMLLDRCCRPLEGLNLGGRVPLLDDYEHLRAVDEPDWCRQPPFRAGPWTTHGVGNFESWFFIRERDDSRPRGGYR